MFLWVIVHSYTLPTLHFAVFWRCLIAVSLHGRMDTLLLLFLFTSLTDFGYVWNQGWRFVLGIHV